MLTGKNEIKKRGAIIAQMKKASWRWRETRYDPLMIMIRASFLLSICFHYSIVHAQERW